MSIYKSKLEYYVYAYLREDGSPYYVGKGTKRRAWYKDTKNQSHIRLPKESHRIVILESNLTEIGAFALERRMILWYGRKDIGTGILRNLTDGGDGSSGAKRTEDTRKRISLSKKGKRLGIKRPEHSAKMKELYLSDMNHPLKNREPWSKGKTGVYSEETLSKLKAPKSDEAKRNMRGPRPHTRGRLNTEETKKRKSEGMKRVWMERKTNGFVQRHNTLNNNN